MTDDTNDLYQTDEKFLTSTLSDEALEAAAGTEGLYWTGAYTTGCANVPTGDCCW